MVGDENQKKQNILTESYSQLTLFNIHRSIPRKIIHEMNPESNGDITHDAAVNRKVSEKELKN